MLKDEERVKTITDGRTQIDCHGKQRRKYLADKYIITPIHYTELFDKRLYSAACHTITGKYYIFNLEDKEINAKEVETVTLGSSAGSEMLKLIGKSINFKSIFSAEKTVTRTASSANGQKQNDKNNNFNPAGLELYNLISYAIQVYSLDSSNGAFANYLSESIKYLYCEPYLNRIEKVHKLLLKFIKEKTFTADVLKRVKDRKIKNMEFERINLIYFKEHGCYPCFG